MAISNVFNSNGGTTSDGSVEYTVTEETSITITHTFSTRPNVFIVDENGNLIITDIKYLSSTQILINFVISFTGIIILR